MTRADIQYNLKLGQKLFIMVGRIGHRITEVNKKGTVKVKTSADPKVYPEAAGWVTVKGKQIAEQ